MFFKIKLKGGALYIALIISVVTGIILSMFVMIAYHNQRQVLSQIAQEQLHFDIKTGLNMARSSYFNESLNNKWQGLDNDDSLRIKRLQWGAYTLINTESKNNRHYIKGSGLYGLSASKDTSILIADRGRPVALAGKIKFTGNCYFPEGGIKPVFIEGESFVSDGPVYSFIKRGPPSIPPIKKDYLLQLKRCMDEFNANTDSAVAALPYRLSNDFSNKTICVQWGNIRLNNYQLSGNIKILCNEITIDSNCYINNVLIIANKATLRPGFKGSVHIIAKDSIIVEKRTFLDYPSSLTVISNISNGNGMRGVFIGENCVIHGSLLAINELNNNDNSKVIVKLNKDIELYGLLYSSNYAHVQGKYSGMCFAKACF